MASFVYTFWSITNVASLHCSVRPEISPCTCEPTYSHNYVELSCEKVDSFHTIVDALSNKFEPIQNISLKISHSQLEDLEMRSFMEMKINIVKLRMNWNALRSVPELPFRGLANVEYLGVGDNELEEIPKHMLNHMPIVKTLDIGRCRIKSVLQEDFRGTQLLANLFMPSNNITRLDNGTFPPGLVTLHLGRNQIETLNGTLRHLNKLESLFINMNQIKNLENELPESNRIKLIIAQNNRLEHLPESMRQMDKLETLHVQHNHLISLDRVLRNAKNLNEFYAFNNRIESLARDEFQMATKLEDIYIASNNIKSLNGSLLPMHKLFKANFSFNSIEEFSMDEIRGLLSLKQLDLSYNRIGKLLGSRENNIDKQSYLIEFYLDFNELTTLDGALMGLNSLRILGLTHNRLERILPDDFIGLEKLEILELSHNRLLTLREMQTTVLPSLKILKVDYNNLTVLDKDFHGLPVLCQANLTHNQITHVSHELVAKTNCMNHNVPGKLELFLDENSFSCNMLMNEYCPLLLNTDKRLRLRTRCFDEYEDVCKNRPVVIMLPSEHIQQVIPVILPNPELLQKADNMLPPLFAPLAGGQGNMKPLILASAPLNMLESSGLKASVAAATVNIVTTTTTTTTEVPSTTTMYTSPLKSAVVMDKAIIASSETHNLNETNGNESSPANPNSNTNNSNVDNDANADDKEQNKNTALPTATTAVTTAPTIQNQTAVNETITAVLPPNSQQETTTTITTTTTQAPASVLVLNIDESQTAIPPENVMVPKTEYSTVEYSIPAAAAIVAEHQQQLHQQRQQLSQSNSQPLAPDVLPDEDSKSNSIHGEYHTKNLSDFDNAPPQSLLQPDEPPENP